jgi:hypothetical protein
MFLVCHRRTLWTRLLPTLQWSACEQGRAPASEADCIAAHLQRPANGRYNQAWLLVGDHLGIIAGKGAGTAMPKRAKYLLLWSEQQGGYYLFTQDQPDHALLQADDAAWFSWLTTHASFSFQGRQGHLNLLKEARPRGEGYWYAYRRQGKRMRMRYIGHHSELTTARLEATAQLLSQACSPTPTPSNGGQPPSLC